MIRYILRDEGEVVEGGTKRGKVVRLVKVFQRDYLKRGGRWLRQILEINVTH